MSVALMALFNYIDQLDRGARTFKTSEEMSELDKRVVGKMKEQVAVDRAGAIHTRVRILGAVLKV